MKPACTDRPRDPAGERGIALVAVLWILALLATLVLGFVVEARTSLRIVHNDGETAKARSIADAGVTLAILGVFDPAPATQWRGDGSVHTLRYGGGTIQARIEDEDGKLDVNSAPIQALRNLFHTLGAADADQIAAAIDARRAAARATVDQSSGRPAPPAFHVLEDLRGLPGMTAALYARLPDFVTVYSAQGSVDPQTAPREVLLSLPNIDPAQIQTDLAARSGPHAAGSPTISGQQLLPSSPLRVFTIVSEGRTAQGTRFVRRAIVTLTGVPDAPYRFLAWRQGRRDAVSTAPRVE